MTIKQFIERAIEGGWKPANTNILLQAGAEYHPTTQEVHMLDVEEGDWYTHIQVVLLDPEAWKAVGKASGWNKVNCISCLEWVEPGSENPLLTLNEYCDHPNLEDYEKKWLCEMHRMIDFLAEGKTLEEYISTL